jgi:hypothetical protein
MNDAPSGYRIEIAMAAWHSVRARLLDEDPSLENDEAALAELLGHVDGEVEHILARVLRAAVHAEVMEKAAAEQAKMTAARAKRYEARGDSLRGLAFAMMDAIGKRKVELPDLTASIVNGRQGVRITDEKLIPDIYVEVVTERKPDKATILSALKASVAVPGAELGNGLDYLTIKKG